MGLKIEGQIERVSGEELSYREFVERHMEKNEPVVVTGVMDDWRACRDWVTPEGNPNLNFFSTNFGKSTVQVADCGIKEFTDQKRADMSVSEFVQKWLNGLEEQHADISESDSKSVLYLKDWHFVKEYPEYLAYTTPLLFSDDWLNLYLDYHRMHMGPYQETSDISCSDYRFVYMGAKGSWTPLHADVFRSYSWSANVCGKKRWLFLSPSQHQLVFDRNMKYTVYDIFDEVSDATFPGFSKAIWLECIQEQNEIIFVPSGWYHQVHNMEDTISINHNWFNAYNLSWIWDLLTRDYNEAKGYIEDIRDICDDFEGLCQRNLAINTGMNYHDFFTFITRFTFANLALLYVELKGQGGITCTSSSVASQLAQNLISVRKVVLKMQSAEGLASNTNMVDSRGILNDPCFLNFCTGLHKVYDTTHRSQTGSCESRDSFMGALEESDFRSLLLKVGNPEELVNCIDSCTVAKLNEVAKIVLPNNS